MVPERVSRILSAYVDGELEARQCKAVERLLQRSSKARELLRGLQKDAERLHNLPHVTLVPDLADQVLNTIANCKVLVRPTPIVRSPVPSWLGLAVTAAALLLVVGLRSYLHFATLDRPDGKGLLASNFELASPERAQEAEGPALADAQPTDREVLHSPLAEIEAKTFSPKIASTDEGIPPSKSTSPNALGSQIKEDTNSLHLNDLEERIVLVSELGDLDRATLKRELPKWAAHVMDLRSTNPAARIERLQAVFQPQGIQFAVDPEAKALLKLSVVKNAGFAVYFEDVAADEIVAGLGQLDAVDTEGKRGVSRYEKLMVNLMAPDDEQRLWRLFGVDPNRAKVPLPLPVAGVDSLDTLKTPNRRAIVVAYTPSRPRPGSAELKRFLDDRRERRADALQIILVLNFTRN
jgi:hypothetical protein